MRKAAFFLTVSLLALMNFGVLAQQAPSSGSSGELRFTAPTEWIIEKPSSKMRVAQYKLPKAEGDKEDASLVVYYFGANQGGSVADNIERWIGQMQQPDGTASKDKAKTDAVTVNGLKIGTVDVTGTYTAEIAPGSTEHHNDQNYRLRAAVIETPKGFYYLKLVGPSKTVERWGETIDSFIRSFEFK